jgi:hypothetical protein
LSPPDFFLGAEAPSALLPDASVEVDSMVSVT